MVSWLQNSSSVELTAKIAVSYKLVQLYFYQVGYTELHNYAINEW